MVSNLMRALNFARIARNRRDGVPRAVRKRLTQAAREHFGWQELRPAQLTAMSALLRRRDALVVLPTGAGKSAVYQVPATLLPGPTVVISPLLALQHDQLSGLNGRDNPKLRGVRVSSAETPAQQERAIEAIRDGTAEFLFITPEQLANPERRAQVRDLKPSLVAVDEAHCISSWGHDFRPDYLALGHYLRDLGRPTIVALTATASPPVREDIVERLGLTDPATIISGLDRPNLTLTAVHCPTEEHRWRRLLAVLDRVKGTGIIYVPTRRAAEETAEKLTAKGYEAQAYHGAMAAGTRAKRHEDFLDDRIPIMVATSAFGMGIDKPDIRWIIHLALPDSPDSYLQEIGRAGRDGQHSDTYLLYRGEDVSLQRYFTGGAPDAEEITALAAVLREKPSTRTALRERTGLGPRKLAQLLALLEQIGVIVVDGNNLRVPPHAPEPAEAALLALAAAERHITVSRSRIDMMRAYAESESCRTRLLLAYFGEELADTCGHCDNCADGSAAEELAETESAERPFALNTTVHHKEWGSGMVLGYEGDRMTVLFDDVGYKTLSVPVVVAGGLLAHATA